MPPSTFLLSYHPQGETALERLVDAARAACLIDTAGRAREAGFDRVVLDTTEGAPFERLAGVEVEVDARRSPFGVRLRRALERQGASGSVCYAGSGMPLMAAGAWAELAERAAGGEVVVNNLYSTDLICAPAAALRGLPDELSDNALGLHLRDQAGQAPVALTRTAAALLDIDTPTDLAVLSLCAGVRHFEIGPALGALLESQWPPGVERLIDATDRLTTRDMRVLVIGRVGSAVWQALETETAARVRVISEERGMRARGDRDPRSLLGYHLGAVGPRELVQALGELGEAIFLDARPLWAHLDWQPSRGDRFAADAGDWQAITQPHLREFSRAVAEARVPIVVGGHALVSGGLLALIDVAWTRWEGRQGIDDDAEDGGLGDGAR